jgi:hypothetical protein
MEGPDQHTKEIPILLQHLTVLFQEAPQRVPDA